ELASAGELDAAGPNKAAAANGEKKAVGRVQTNAAPAAAEQEPAQKPRVRAEPARDSSELQMTPAKPANGFEAAHLAHVGEWVGASAAAALSPGAQPGQPGQPPASASAALVPVAGLAVEIAARAQAGRNRFEIRLDPPELGRIDVRLDVDASGQVTSR